MTKDQIISDVHNLIQAEHHLRNQGKNGELDDGYITARPYLQAVSFESGLSVRIENMWLNESPAAARREVLRLALQVTQ